MAVVLAGCGARMEYRLDSIEIERPNWDSLEVNVGFEQRSAIGRSRRIEPDSMLVLALRSDGDSLFAGAGPGFTFPDNRLGNGERVTLDVCGALRGRWVCEQATVRASPKRIQARAEVDFPTDSDFRQGRFAIAAEVEREVFGGEGMEAIRFEGAPSMIIEAYVDGAESSRVRFTARTSTGSFDLSRSTGYADFRYHLDSRMMDLGEAIVHFVVYAGIETADEPVARIVRTVSAVRHVDRGANVQGFARQAGRILANDLASFFGSRQVSADVQSWHLNEVHRRYEIDVEVRWRGSLFDQRDYVLVGVLEVGEGGESAVFNLREGNRNALERWDRRVRESRRHLGNLEVVRPAERYRPGSRRQEPL